MAKQIGYTEEDLQALKEYETAEQFNPALKVAIKLAEKMTLNPHRISDADFTELRQHYSETEIVELTSVIGLTNYFNRFTTTLRIDLSGTDAPYESFPVD